MGLKQGCNLSPLLANIYSADLHDLLSRNNYNPPILTNSSIRLISWADDFMLLSLERESLQHCIQTNRPILIKFRYTGEKDSFLYNLHLHRDKFPFHTKETGKHIKEDEIERLHYKYCKFSLNLP